MEPPQEPGDAVKLIYKRKKRKPTSARRLTISQQLHHLPPPHPAPQLQPPPPPPPTLRHTTNNHNTTKICKISSRPVWAPVLLMAILFCDTSAMVYSQPAEPSETNNTTTSRSANFSEEPRDSVVLLGEPADFTCQTENQTKRFLFWYRNHVSLGVGTTAFAAHARRYQLHISAGETRTNYSLHINAVTWQDDTNFRCVIQAGLADTQSPTETSSRRAQLTVLKPPERLSVRALSLDSQEVVSLDSDNSTTTTTTTSRVQVRHGQRIRLECRTDQSKPHAELIWLDHEQAQVARTDSNQIEQLGQELGGPQELVEADSVEPKLSTSTSVWHLTVDRERHSAKPLTCVARHAAFNEPQAIPQLYGHELRHQVQLEVLYAPHVQLEKLGHAQEHQPLRIRCRADAKPAGNLVYRWFIDEKLVANATGAELLIGRVTRQLHLREIRCEARNSIGAGQASLRLAVQHRPAFVSHLLPPSLQPSAPADSDWAALGQQLAQTFDEGQDVTLRCDFDAYPQLQQVLWFKVNSDYSTMANVTPDEADELVAGGAAHAVLRPGAESGLVGLDYEQMSADLVDELALYEQHPARSSIVQPLQVDSQLIHTSAKIYESLDWQLRANRPIGSSNASALNLEMTQELNGSAAGQYLELFESAQSRHKFVEREATISSSSITIRRANVDSVGRYVCKARSGSADQVKLARSLFLVMRRPPRIVSSPEQYAPLGASQLRLDCLAQINMVLDNSTSFVWSRDGKIIESVSTSAEPDKRSVVISSQRSPDLLFMRSELTINQAQLSDFGTYECTVKNSIHKDSLLISLKLTAPTGLAFVYMASLAVGSILILACIVGLLLAFASIGGARPKAPPVDVIDAERKSPQLDDCCNSSNNSTTITSTNVTVANHNHQQLVQSVDTNSIGTNNVCPPERPPSFFQQQQQQQQQQQHQRHMVPTSDSGDAFFESNYGTLLSRSSVYKTLGYSTNSPPACAYLSTPGLQTNGSTGSSSPSSMTTHANHIILPSQENHNYAAPIYQSATDFRHIHSSPLGMQAVIVDSSSPSSNTTITCNLIKDSYPATHV